MATQLQPDREERLAEILLSYLDAVQEGKQPDRRQLLAEHPEFAEELSEFFAGREQMERLAAPLRADAKTPVKAQRVGPALSASAALLTRIEPVVAGTPPAVPIAPGTEAGQLGDFRLLREIGRGGMGIVYEAEQISLNRRVALKVLPFAAALDPKHLQRFKNEAQAAAQLHHSNIVPVYAVGCERSVHYYAMQYIEGQSLATVIDELQRLAGTRATQALTAASPPSALVNEVAAGKHPRPESPGTSERTHTYAPLNDDAEAPAAPAPAAKETAPQAAASTASDCSIKSKRYFRRVAELGAKAAEALEHAHQLGVIHRDIKPANLLLDVRGDLWVTDFGLALFKSDAGLTITGELLGTLRYMSPEQTFAKRGLVDHRTDIYSLGATLYELLTLEPVFTGHDRQELLHHIAFDEPRPPRAVNRAIPVELETIVLKALAKNPPERYATAQELADDLKRYLQDQPVLARRPTLMDRSWKWALRHRAWAASIAVILACLSVTTFVLACALYEVCAERTRANEEAARANDAAAKEFSRAVEASRQSERADKSFQEARRAVDFFTQVAAQDLNLPKLQPVRRKLLENSLSYYKSFIQQREDDPSTQKELVASALMVGTILKEMKAPFDALEMYRKAEQIQKRLVAQAPESAERRQELEAIQHTIFALQGGEPLDLLSDPHVQHELGLCAIEVVNVLNRTKQIVQKELAQCPEFARLGQAEQQAQYVAMLARNAQSILGMLNGAQKQRLRQIQLQRLGAAAFDEPDVVDALKLSADQIQRIGDVLQEAIAYSLDARRQQSFSPVPGSCHGGTCPLDKILAVFTPEQRAKWKKLIGKPFQSGGLSHPLDDELF